MHCPKCGTPIEAETTSFCTRCGQQLDRVRAAMSDTAIEVRHIETSHASLNLGVGLMYVGVWPALLAVIYSPIAIPAALLMLTSIWFVILLGSGPLLRLFQHYDMPKEIERARRREIGFGSTLMFFATIITSIIVAVTTGRSLGADVTIIIAITAAFVLLLASSKILFQGYRNLTTNEPQQLEAADRHALTTGDLDDDDISFPTRQLEYADRPPSVTEGTTRHLKNTSSRENLEL
jgi:predicted nucleic acid-binding Zn ribbon protein